MASEKALEIAEGICARLLMNPDAIMNKFPGDVADALDAFAAEAVKVERDTIDGLLCILIEAHDSQGARDALALVRARGGMK